MLALPSGTVTFLFTDIEGSTLLLQRLGDLYGRMLGDHRRLVRIAVEGASGVEVDCRADEFFGAFADAHDAVRAAVSAQRALKLHQWPAELRPPVRMGIHTGEPAVADGSYLGLDVHRAARICSAASGGQVLISEATRNVLAETGVAGVSFSDLGEHELKGLPRPEHIFQLVVDDLRSEFPPLRGADTGAVEPRAFEGRERELEQAAVGRLRQTLSSLRRVGSTTPGLEELAWRVRALLPLALPGEQKPLAELSRALLTTGRSAAETDRYLAILDRDSMYRDLREYRELGVTSKRAAEKAEALANRIAHIERLATRRKQVQETTTRLTADIRSLSESIRSRLASRPADLSAELATLRLRAESADLEGLLAAVQGQLDLMNLKLRRTRHRGVFRHGERYIVPYYDEVGLQHRKAFQTRDEARSFRWSVRFAQKNKGQYTGAFQDKSGVANAGSGAGV